MLFQDLKNANMAALKNKDNISRSILSIVINKCMLLNVEKRVTNQELNDLDVIAILQKTIKEVEEEADAFKQANRNDQYQELLKQKEVLSKYLPIMLSQEEIRSEINKLDDKSIPAVMKYFKTNFNGKCDMKLVNIIAKDYN